MSPSDDSHSFTQCNSHSFTQCDSHSFTQCDSHSSTSFMLTTVIGVTLCVDVSWQGAGHSRAVSTPQGPACKEQAISSGKKGKGGVRVAVTLSMPLLVPCSPLRKAQCCVQFSTASCPSMQQCCCSFVAAGHAAVHVVLQQAVVCTHAGVVWCACTDGCFTSP